MFSAIGSLWGYLSLVQLLEVALMGESGVPSAGLHPRTTRMTVITARLALGWMLLLMLLAVVIQ